MSDHVTASVCMATYNGEAYVEHQLRSILAELESGDEVIVVDDASADSTVAVVESLDDSRIRVVRQSVNRGYVRSFEAAMLAASGDVLAPRGSGRRVDPRQEVAARGRCRAGGGGGIQSRPSRIGRPLRSPLTGRPWRLRAATSRQRRRNELRILAGAAPYFGCAMAVRRDALRLVRPFPRFSRSPHDLWIASAANSAGALVHVDAPTVRRRVHGGNASTDRPRGVRAALRSRALVLRLLAEGRRRAQVLGPTDRRLLGAR